MDVSSSDRWIAAASHLGVPLYGPVLPGVIWATSSHHSFRRIHAAQAFSFQVVFIVVWVLLIGTYLVTASRPSGAPENGPFVLLGVLLITLVLELPNVVLALAGKPPLPLPPFWILR
jgi:hypothetical protein